jgi:hypothetical protein
MDTSDVATRVVAWHNRHPLASHIGLADVHDIGLVALPFAQADGGTPLPLFSHAWLYRLTSRRLEPWVLRHGAADKPAALGDWPLHRAETDATLTAAAEAAGARTRIVRHLITAAVDSDGHRVRLLLAPGSEARKLAVFGARHWSLPRLGTATATLALLGAAAAIAPGLMVAEHDAPPVLAALPAATVASAASAAAVVVAVAPTASTAVAVLPAAPVLDTAPGKVSILPSLTDAQRHTARLQADAARLATASVAPPAAAASASTAPAAAGGHQFAIVTPPAPSRDDAQAQQVLLQGLLAQTRTAQPTRLDVMPAGHRWRVVWWPHPQRAEAEALMLQARARGLKVELIDF